MDYRIIRVTFEWLSRMFPVHPPVEPIVHEKVGEQRRNRRALRGPLLSCHKGPVCHLHGGFKPPFDVKQDPALLGVVSDRLQHQIMGNTVKKKARTSKSKIQS